MSFFSTWEDETADEMRQRLTEEMIRRKAETSYNQYRAKWMPNLDGSINASAAQRQAEMNKKLEKQVSNIFDTALDQLNQLESDYKKFNSDWNIEGRAACYVFNVLQEHLMKARQGIETGKRTCLDFAKP